MFSEADLNIRVKVLLSYKKIIFSADYNDLIKKLPQDCPSCSETLLVSELTCSDCGTRVAGAYALPLFLQLSQEEQDFVLRFVLSGGSLKKMEAQLKKSYPTVRNILDDVIEKLWDLQMQGDEAVF